MIIDFDDQPAGSEDRTFNVITPLSPTPGANNRVLAVAVDRSTNGVNTGKSMIGGDFTGVNAVVRNRIARLNVDGSTDLTFNPGSGADDFVDAIVVQPDGKILIAGAFTSINNISRKGVARLNANGSLDSSFNPGSGLNGTARALLLQADGGIIVAGEFTTCNDAPRKNIARLNSNGSLDTAFDPGVGPNGVVRALARDNSVSTVVVPRQADGTELEDRNVVDTGANSGTIIIDYDFLFIPDNIRVYYDNVRIFDLTTNGSGQIVLPYGPGASTTVEVVMNEGTGQPGTAWSYTLTINTGVNAGERVLVGGDFTEISGKTRNRVARLTINGTVDPTFAPIFGADNSVYALTVQTNGAILAGGSFTTFDGKSRNGVARLNTTGTLDPTFNPGTGVAGLVNDIKLQVNGQAVIVGDFVTYNGTPRTNLARLYLNGTLDTSFMDIYYNQTQPGSDGFVSALSFQTNGNIIIGGVFSRVGGGFTLTDIGINFNVARIIGGTNPPAFNMPGNVEFVSGEYSIDENVLGGLLTITVMRTNGSVAPLIVNYSTSNGTAIAGTDYTVTSGQLRWEFCEMGVRTFTIPIIDNGLIQPNRTFNLTLSNPFSTTNEYALAYPSLGFQSSAVVTIVDNDFAHGVLGFSAPVYSIAENGGLATITVTRTNGAVGPVSVQYTTSNGSATAPADYTARSGTLFFASGQTTNSFTIPIINDTAVEPEETINLTLFSTNGGATLGLANATLLIFDNDNGPGSLSFSNSTFFASEGSGTATITVRRTSGGVGTNEVDVLTVEFPPGPGNAREGVDYTYTSNHLVFGPGVMTQTFTVAFTNDALVEGDEILGLRLTNLVGAGTLGFLTNATLTIVDDDFYGSLSFNDVSYYVNEKGTNALITLIRTGGSADEVTVDVVTSPGTATEGADFTGITNTITFSNGVTMQTFLVPIANDFLLEPNETIFLTLFNFTKASPGVITNATLTIIDDESQNLPAGSVDTSFESLPGPNGFVNALSLQSSGKLIIAGDFTIYHGVGMNRIARLNPDGTLDPLFTPGSGANTTVHALAVQPDQKIIVGGSFTNFNGTNRSAIARLDSDGTVDSSFNPGAGADNPIFAVALKADGKVVVGGSFTTFNGVSRPNLALLTTNGAVAPGFDTGTGVNGPVYAVAVQLDGKILIGGDFTTVNNTNRSRVARLNADGSLDLSFNPGLGADGPVRAIVVQPDGAVVIGGSFTNVDVFQRSRLARLTTNGAVDVTFLATGSGANSGVLCLALQANNKILVGGDFTFYNDVHRSRLTRVNADGAVDPTINIGTGADSFIGAVILQPDQQILIGGGFTSFDGTPRDYVARLIGGENFGAGAFEFLSAGFTVRENGTNAIITVRRNGGTTGNTTVQLATTNLTAINGTDFLGTNGVTLSFVNAETLQTFLIPIINNTNVDGDRVLDLGVFNPTGTATLDLQTGATLTIIDDDSRVSFITSTYSVNEGVIGQHALINLVRSGATNSTVSVNYATTTNGTATAGVDYGATNGVVLFLPGETTKAFIVPIFEDSFIEGPETIGLTLSNAVVLSSINSTVIINPITNATLTIVDNDTAPGQITFVVASNTISEAAGPATIYVLRTNGSSGTVSVHYNLINGTAVAGVDYTNTSGILTFANGQTLQSFNVPIINNTNVDGDRTLFLTLTSPVNGASLGLITNASLTILDDEFAPSYFIFSAPEYGVNEFDPFATITVLRTNSRRGMVSVVVATANGTATAGQDYTTTVTNLTFLENETVRTFSIPIINDRLGEGDETVLLTLSLLDVTNFIGQGSATLIITNDDTTLRFSTNAYSVSEQGTNAVITVVRAGVTNTAVSVDYFTTPGTAVAGLDYVPVTGTLSWAPNDPAAKTFLVPIVDNTSLNTDRTFFVHLTNVVGTPTTYLENPSNAVVTIVNEESVNPVAGNVDPTFNGNFGANRTVYAVAFDPADRLYAGGDFTQFHGLAQNHITRLNANGAVDTAFNIGSGFDGSVFALAVNGTNSVVVGGEFLNYNGVAAGRIAFLNADGTPVPSFAPSSGADGTVYAVGLATEPKIQFSRSSFLGTLNNNSNIINVGANAGSVTVTYNFAGTTNAGVINNFRIYYDGSAIFQTNLPTSTNGVTRATTVAFGPGTNTTLTIVVNQGLTNGTAWDYSGTVTVGGAAGQKIVLGGAFSSVNGVAQGHVARLNGDGSLDPVFQAGIGSGADQTIYAVAVQDNGQTFVAGDFTTFNGASALNVARLNTNGTLDQTFSLVLGTDGSVRTLAVQTNGSVVIGGDFITVGGVPRNHIARLLSDGTVDLSFDPLDAFDGNVRSITIDGDGKILVGGEFTSFNGNLNHRIVRLFADGTIDETFNSGDGANNVVHSVALARPAPTAIVIPRQADGTELEDVFVVETGANSGVVAIDYDFLFIPDNIRIYYNGVRLFDLTTNDVGQIVVPYGPGPSTQVTIIMNEGNGQPGTVWNYTATITTVLSVQQRRIGLGGDFTAINGEPRHRVAVLDGDGSLYAPFDPGAAPNKSVYAVGIYTNTAQPSLIGKLVVGGDFNTLVGVSQQNRVSRLHFDGTVDTNFNAGVGPNGTVRAVALQPDGRVVLGGSFTTVGATNRAYLARLNADGALDATFNPGVGINGAILALAPQADGKFIIGGTFNLVYGSAHNGVARVHTNGTVDVSFANVLGGANGAVKAVVIDSIGRVIIAGDFTVVNNQSRNHIARLNANGTLDASFNPPGGANGSIEAVALQSDGQIVIGGAFHTFNGTPNLNGLARLNPDGTLDGSFNAGGGANSFVSSIAIQTDDKLVVGGAFTTFGGQDRNRLVRLNPNGSLDPTVNFGTGANNFINAVALQNYDGKIVVGGGFTRFDGEVRVSIARLFSGTNTGAGQFQFSATNYNVAEGAGGAILTVLRKGGTSGAADVSFNTADNSATAPGDYTSTSTVLHFAAGETFHTVSVPVIDNPLTNANKKFIATLSAPTGGAGLAANSSAVVTIIDNDSVLTFSAPAYTVGEGGGNARITVTRLGGASETVRVNYATGTNGTATPFADFTPVNGTLVFIPGVRQQSFDVPILEDAIPELTETVSLVLTNPTGPATLGALTNVLLSIVDNETDPGVLTLSTNTFPAGEGDGFAIISVSRTNGFFGTVSVQFNTTNFLTDFALPGVKYVATNGVLSFAPGETNKSFMVQLINETNFEGAQTFSVQLANPVGATIGLDKATVVIGDDDTPGSVEFVQSIYSVNETGGSASITLRRVGGSVGVISVSYATSGGTATPGVGSDYLPVSGQVTFASGQTTTNFVIPIFDDALVEGTETVGLILSTNANSNGAFIGAQGTATLLIIDNESAFTFSAPTYTVTESGFAATITVFRYGNTNLTATVDFITTPGSASAVSDYVFTNGTLTFAPGQTNISFLVKIVNDTLPEPDEFLNLTLSNPSGGASLVPYPTAVLTIFDDDVTLSFSSPTYSVTESFTNVTIPVFRSGATDVTSTVQYTIADGTATAASSDYSGVNGTLIFAPGVVSNSFTVSVFDDAIVEGNETVILTLLNPTGGLLGGQPSAVLSIIDNDRSVGFSTTNYVVNEKATNAVITLVRKGVAAGAVSVVFTTGNGTAISSSDYLITSNVVSWADGDLTPKTVLVPILDDAILEGSETVNLNLSNPTGGAVLEIGAATLFIVDNAGSISFASVNYSVVEGSNAVLALIRTGGTSGVVTVQYSVSGGTATDGLDYTNSIGLIAFANGETTKNITLPTIDDALVEGVETVNVRLFGAAGGARVGDPATATLTIYDNEVGIIVASGSALISEVNGNGTIDPSETVTVLFSLRNAGTVNTTNLHATLLPGNGISSPSAFQDYGAVIASGNSVSRPFTFTATGTNGSQITATLLLTDGVITNGYVTFTYTIGVGSVTFANASSITINDNGPASPYPAVINVAGVGGAISKVTVTLNNLTHGFPDDLDIVLVGPHGQTVMLMSDSGGGNALNNVTLTLDDAFPLLPDSAQIITGTYGPKNNGVQGDPFPAPGPVQPFGTALSVFNGTDANGLWSLYIVDDTSQDSGLIAGGWSLTISTSGGLPAFADLSISASDSPDPVLLNGSLTYSISVTNHGPGTATNVLFTNTLPAGVAFVSASSSQGTLTPSAGKVIGNLGTLAYGQFATVTINVTAPNFITTLTNTATITCSQTDANPGNNLASIKTTVGVVPALGFARKSSSFVVTWPASAVNFVLQVTPTLTPPAWVDATNAVANINGTNTVSVPLSTGATRFYRLRIVP